MSSDLTKGFNSVSELRKLDYDNDVNILMGGSGITNRLSLQAVIARNVLAIEKEQKEFVEYILQLSHQQIIEKIQEAQEQILDAIQRMNDVIIFIDRDSTNIQNTLQNITRRHQELNDAIEARHFEKDAKGNYKCKAIADTIAAYEQRTGKKIPDDITPEMLILILRSQEDFEKTVVIPKLEKVLVELNEFRDKVQSQKGDLEEENKRIDDALKAIDADNSLSDEERRNKKAEILEKASNAALDAQMAATDAENGYVELVVELRNNRWDEDNALYYEHSNNEDADLNQSALDELQNIKPLLPPSP